jgi:hypothetical protein
LKDNKPKVFRILELRDHAGFRAALEKLDKLSLADAEADRQVELMKSKINGMKGDAGRYMQRIGAVLYGDEGSLDRLAAKIIATASVSPGILAEARSGTLKPPATVDLYDVEIITKIQEASARKELFRRAVTLQRREVLRQKNLAIAEICESLQSDWTRIARALAASLLEFGTNLRDAISFVDRLRVQDEAIPAYLSPRPFPLTSSPSDPEAVEWVAEVLTLSQDEAKLLLAAGGESPCEVA